jgi:hypothetical protein
VTRRTLAFALFAGLLLAAPARAEPLRLAQGGPAMLPAHEIATIVRSAGFVPISPAIRRGEIYVMRASARDGREMRLTVEARRGRILSAQPVPDEVAMPGVRAGPYERMDPPGYIEPGDPDSDDVRSGPPVVYEGGRPLIYERRPGEPIPAPPGGTRLGARGPGQDIDAPPPIMREEGGPLPPPPERFPQRVGPGAAPKPGAKPPHAKPAAEKLAPVKRAAAGPPPLPRPKPAAASAEEPSKQSWESQAAESEADPAAADSPSPPAPPAKTKTDPRALPH